ncbi:MAG: hypothetical protein ACRD0C_13840, partial [Acidimicrobiia bacterium]
TLSSPVAQSAQLQVCDELRHAQRSLEWSDELAARPPAAEADDSPPAAEADARPPAAEADDSDTDGGTDLAKATWMDDPAFQPLRRAVELALTISDWGEVIVAVDLVLEGLLQPFQRELLAAAGRAERDMATAMLGRHCWIDEERHLGWSEAFLRLALESEPANRDAVQAWCDVHTGAAVAALDALAGGYPFGGAAEAAAAVARTELGKRLEGLGLEWRQP